MTDRECAGNGPIGRAQWMSTEDLFRSLAYRIRQTGSIVSSGRKAILGKIGGVQGVFFWVGRQAKRRVG